MKTLTKKQFASLYLTSSSICAYNLPVTDDSRQHMNSKGNKRGVHPNSRANLHPFVKGQPPMGNSLPGGGSSLLNALYRQAAKPLKQPPDGAPVREFLAHSTLEGAIKREAVPFREAWDRLEGKVPQPISGVDGKPLVVTTFVFQLPDGTKIEPGDLVKLGNSSNGDSDRTASAD